MTNLIFGSLGWKKADADDLKLKSYIKDLNEIDSKLCEKNIQIDLLLCAGFTVDTVKKRELKNNLKSLKNIKNILFEKYTDPNPESEYYMTNYCLYSKNNNKLTTFSPQLFETTYRSKATETSITKVKSNQLAESILNGERCFKIKKQDFVLLICGENNIIKGNKPNKMDPLILKYSSDKKEDIEKIFNKSIIVNPSHYPYRINGKKRLEMMKNITKYPAKIMKDDKEYCLLVSNYLHANNYSEGYKKMFKKENLSIGSKYPNGSFFFSKGVYKVTNFTYWGNNESFILNVWEI